MTPDASGGDKPLPRQYALVKVRESYREFIEQQGHDDCALAQEDVFVFLGEIPNMRGHCVVAGHKSGRIASSYHVENFVEIPEDET